MAQRKGGAKPAAPARPGAAGRVSVDRLADAPPDPAVNRSADPPSANDPSRELLSAPAASAPSRPEGGSVLLLPGRGEPPPRRKSYAEVANEQLNPVGRGDPLAEDIRRAGLPDCMKDGTDAGLLGMPVLIYKAVNGRCR